MTSGDIPRWATSLGGETWERINELLYEGWQPAAVRRELGIPKEKARSLQEHARKYRSRRILAPLARLREKLTGGMESLTPDTLKLLQLGIAQSLSPDAELKQINRTAAILGKFMALIETIGQRVEEREDEREGSDANKIAAVDANEALRRIDDVYGVGRGEPGDG